MVWWRLSDVFSLCGPMITFLVVLQVASCLMVTHFVMKFMDVNHPMMNSILIVGVLTIDCVILACQRGRHYKELWQPFFVWNGLFTVLPGLVAFVWIKLSELL